MYHIHKRRSDKCIVVFAILSSWAEDGDNAVVIKLNSVRLMVQFSQTDWLALPGPPSPTTLHHSLSLGWLVARIMKCYSNCIISQLFGWQPPYWRLFRSERQQMNINWEAAFDSSNWLIGKVFSQGCLLGKWWWRVTTILQHKNTACSVDSHVT